MMRNGFQPNKVNILPLSDFFLYLMVKRVHSFSEWMPELSGCYRPEYLSKLTAEGVENNVVTDINPVVVMASNKTSNGASEYEAGMNSPLSVLNS